MRMSVRTKLFGAFGVVIALMVVLGFVAIAKLGSVNSRATYLGDTSIPSAEITARVRSASANYRRVQNRLIFASEKDRPRFLKEPVPAASRGTTVAYREGESISSKSFEEAR